MVKNPLAHAGDPGLIPGSGRPTGEGNGNPLHHHHQKSGSVTVITHTSAAARAQSASLLLVKIKHGSPKPPSFIHRNRNAHFESLRGTSLMV